MLHCWKNYKLLNRLFEDENMILLKCWLDLVKSMVYPELGCIIVVWLKASFKIKSRHPCLPNCQCAHTNTQRTYLHTATENLLSNMTYMQIFF